MAVVAVLEIHIENPNAMAPMATTARRGEPATILRAMSQRAARRSKPWADSPLAKKKPPMNRKIRGSAKGARADRASVTPSITARAGAMRAVTARGIASVTHRTTVMVATAARRWAGSESDGMGVANMTTRARGPPTSPTRRRMASNRASESLMAAVATVGPYQAPHRGYHKDVTGASADRPARTLAVPAVLLVLALTWLGASTGLVSSNDGSHVALARALALRGTTRIDPETDLTLKVDRAIKDGHHYSDRPPGTGFLAIPAVWAGAQLDPLFTRVSEEIEDVVLMPAGANYVDTHAKRATRSPPLGTLQGTALLLGVHTALVGLAGLGGLSSILRRRGVSDTGRAVVVGAIGLGTLWGPYSTMLFSHVTTASMVVGLLWALQVDRDEGFRTWWVPALGGLCGGWAVSADYLALLLVVPLVLVGSPPRRWGWIGLGVLPIAVATAAYQRAAFGSVFTIGYDAQSNFAFARSRATTFDGNPVEGLWTLLGAGRGAGLLAQSPIALVGLAWAWVTDRRWLLATIPFVLALSLHRTPFGGGTEDARYLIPALPIVALGLGGVWQRTQGHAGARWVVPALGLVSAALVWAHFLAWRG